MRYHENDRISVTFHALLFAQHVVMLLLAPIATLYTMLADKVVDIRSLNILKHYKLQKISTWKINMAS